MALSSAVGRLLRASIVADAGGATALPESARDTEALRGLASGAAFHGIGGYVRRLVDGTLAVPPSELAALDDLVAWARAQHLRVVATLPMLQDAFEADAVPWVVVKGPVLAEPLHGDASLRTYDDLDLLVPARRFEDAVSALEDIGAVVLGANWQQRLEHLAGEVPLRLPNGLLVDLHWHVINDGALRRSFDVSVEELFEKRAMVTVGGQPVPTLDPVDTLIHLAMHTVLSGCHRLVWLKDVELALARLEPEDLVAVRERARQRGAVPALLTVLRRIRHLFGHPIPETITAESGAAWALWCRLSDAAALLSPVERQDGGPSLLRIASRAVRPSAAASLREFVSRSGHFATSRLRPAADRSTREVDRHSGGDRDEYFAAVRRAQFD